MLPKGTKIKVKDTHNKNHHGTWYAAGDTFTVHSYLPYVNAYTTEQDFPKYGEGCYVLMEHLEPQFEVPVEPEQSSLSTRKDGKVLMDLFDEGFPNAVLEVSRVMTWAAENKGYKPHDWVKLPKAETSFPAAASRHRLASLVQKVSGCEVSERVDKESKILHKAHEAFNVLAELELMLRGIIK